MKIRYIALALVLAILTPHVKSTILYAAEVKSTYDQVQQISKTDVVLRLASGR